MKPQRWRPYVPRATSPAAPPKYGNKKTVIDGITFHSRMEAQYYGYLKVMKAAGRITAFLRQVPVDLGGGVKHVVDFLLLYPDGYEFVEIKGYDTPASKSKRLIAQDRLGLEITVIDRKALSAITR